MNSDEMCTVVEKGELIAKLGQVIDQRNWGLIITLGEFVLPQSKMNYRRESKNVGGKMSASFISQLRRSTAPPSKQKGVNIFR